ncbi:MAG: hypothetical protein AAF589_00240 [Planctomycetota bacterium]
MPARKPSERVAAVGSRSSTKRGPAGGETLLFQSVPVHLEETATTL